MNRRQFLLGLSVAGVSSLAFSGTRYWPESGLTNPCLKGMPAELKNHPLMHQVWQGIDPSKVWDCHAHIIGAGESGSGAWFNPDTDSWQHPLLKIQKHFYMNGGCVTEHREDASFVERITALADEMPTGYKTMLFAFDLTHDEQGKPLKEHSIFYIPNTYAAQIAKKYPQYFEWVASIHPYRHDALEALELAHANGARAIKWLPSVMNINPSSPKCDPFYQKLHDLNMPMICHSGDEGAVIGGNQSFGNPLYMRRALDRGVRVVLAHCASDGEDEDLDHGRKSIKSFDLFARLMDNPEYTGLVFGEISALPLFNHASAIKPLLKRKEWHGRLLNGSDYPLPAVIPLISTKQLQRAGLLEETHLLFLQTLRNYNPLMFDFALKRLIKFEGASFAANIFETRSFFDATAPSAHHKLIT